MFSLDIQLPGAQHGNTNIKRMTTSITASCIELKHDLSTTTLQSETKQNLHTLGCILDKLQNHDVRHCPFVSHKAQMGKFFA